MQIACKQHLTKINTKLAGHMLGQVGKPIHWHLQGNTCSNMIIQHSIVRPLSSIYIVLLSRADLHAMLIVIIALPSIIKETLHAVCQQQCKAVIWVMNKFVSQHSWEPCLK